MTQRVALAHYMRQFDDYFSMPNVSEICINRPGEIWIEQNGVFTRFQTPAFTAQFCLQFAELVAEANNREIGRDNPILTSVLPNNLRVQFVIEPACEPESFICSMRQKSVKHTTLSDYFLDGASTYQIDDRELLDAYTKNDYALFLKLAVLAKKNILISGGTSTGKTTLLNTLVAEIPKYERLITVETDREVRCSHPNTVHLLATDGGAGVSDVTMLDLLKASLRLRPDRILVSELRAGEAFPYLRAINSGHPGSISTLHSDNPAGAFEQLAFMVLQSGCNLTRAEIISFAKSIIHIVIQISKTTDGKRYISDLYFNQATKNYSH